MNKAKQRSETRKVRRGIQHQQGLQEGRQACRPLSPPVAGYRAPSESGGIDQTRGRSAHSWQPCHLWKGVLKAFITTATGLASLHLAVWRPESAHGPPDPALRAAPAELGGAGGGAASSQGASSHPGPPSEEPPKLPCPRRGTPLLLATVMGTSNTGVCARPRSHEPTPP